MKRYGNLWNQVCDRANIELAAELAVKAKRLTKARTEFLEHKEQMLDALQASLINESYQFSPLYSFTVLEPKERQIHTPPFYPDKILHHAVMNVVKPLFLEKFTADTYGSIKGRGVAMTAEKLKKVLREQPDWYFLQMDVRHFYQSIDHDVCKAAVRRIVKCPKTLKMIDAIIDVHEEGLAIGVYPSQYLANIVLAGIDHHVKEVMRMPYYFRYMDDILLIVPDKLVANAALVELRSELGKIKLDVKGNVRIARKKLKNELSLFMQGERNVERYREAGINWWDYCGSILVNSYPTYFEKLPPLIAKINREKRNSKNYVLFLGETNAESNQAPCLSLVQFQIDDGELVLSAYQRSSDANLGLPADIYHLYLMSRQIELPLKSITLNLGNVHIYESNIDRTKELLSGKEDVRFDLNVN